MIIFLFFTIVLFLELTRRFWFINIWITEIIIIYLLLIVIIIYNNIIIIIILPESSKVIVFPIKYYILQYTLYFILNII